MTGAPDEQTAPARRSEIEERTAPARRNAPDERTAPAQRNAERTAPAKRKSTANPEDGPTVAAPGPRRLGVPAETDAAASATDPSSTAVARPEPRKRPVTRGVDVPGEPVRVARLPEKSAAYGARSANPVVIPRSAPRAREPQAPVDTAASERAVAHRARRRAVVAVVLAAVVAVGAAAALLFLTFA